MSPMNASCRLLRHSKAHWLLPACPPASPSWGRKCLYLSCPRKPADSPQMSPWMGNWDSRRGGGVSHLSIVSVQPLPSLVILESQASESGGGAVGGGDGWQVLEGRGLRDLDAFCPTLPCVAGWGVYLFVCSDIPLAQDALVTLMFSRPPRYTLSPPGPDLADAVTLGCGRPG